MKKTGIVLGILAGSAIVWEFVALADPDDDLWTITAFFRALPCWADAMVACFLSALAAHLWWK